jgi:hypothetical protein
VQVLEITVTSTKVRLSVYGPVILNLSTKCGKWSGSRTGRFIRTEKAAGTNELVGSERLRPDLTVKVRQLKNVKVVKHALVTSIHGTVHLLLLRYINKEG